MSNVSGSSISKRGQAVRLQKISKRFRPRLKRRNCAGVVRMTQRENDTKFHFHSPILSPPNFLLSSSLPGHWGASPFAFRGQTTLLFPSAYLIPRPYFPIKYTFALGTFALFLNLSDFLSLTGVSLSHFVLSLRSFFLPLPSTLPPSLQSSVRYYAISISGAKGGTRPPDS